MTVLPSPLLRAERGDLSIWQPGAPRESEAGQRAQRVSSHHSHTVQCESPHTQPGESCGPGTPRTRGGWARDAIGGAREEHRGPPPGQSGSECGF